MDNITKLFSSCDKTVNDAMKTSTMNNAKRIVLVTWKGGGNYGTCLQSYALHRKLEDLGFDVSLFAAGFHSFGIKTYLKGFLSAIGALKIIYFGQWLLMDKKDRKRVRFQNKAINEIELFSSRQIHRIVLKTDCFVSGSDQIWNTFYNFSSFNFLSFAEEAKRIAYATSIGTNYVKEEYRETVKELLQRYSHIGVREKEAVRVLSELTGREDIRQVLDPTFLLMPQDWMDLAKNSVYESKLPVDYIFCYFIGNNGCYSDCLKEVCRRIGLSCIIIPSQENPMFSFEGAYIYNNAGPVEFVDLLRRAKYVCTDSFHATALCINLSVQFVEFMRFSDDDPRSQNSRIYDLLHHYDLINRIYKHDSSEWYRPIDYKRVQSILNNDRIDSLDFLINSIEN